MSIDSPAARPEGADAPVRHDAWTLHSQGRRFGPLTEDEMRGYFRAGMVKAGDSIEMPGATAAVSADVAAAALGMPAPVAVAGAPVLPTSIVILQPQENRSGWLVTTVALVAIIGLSFFAIRELLKLPPRTEPVVSAPAAMRASRPAEAATTSEPVTQSQAQAEAFPPPPPAPATPAQAAPGLAPGAADLPPQAADTRAPGSVPDDFWSRAASLATAQDWSGLLSHASLWTTSQPANELAWWYLGLANLRLGSLGDAEAAYRRVLQISPRHFDARWGMSNVYLRTNRPREAGALLQELVREHPANAGAWLDLGVAMSNTGEYDEAVASYQKAIQLKPDYRLAWDNLARCYAKFGRMDLAKETAAKANAL